LLLLSRRQGVISTVSPTWGGVLRVVGGQPGPSRFGLVKERDIIHSAAPEGSAGWDIVLVGKATDRSGFGGAAFSSLVLDDEDAESEQGAVQSPIRSSRT